VDRAGRRGVDRRRGGPRPGSLLGGLPLSFVENRGQTDPEVRYVGEMADYAVFFTPDRVVMSLAQDRDTRMVLALRFVGANPDVEPRGQAPTGGQVNYLRGDDPGTWQPGLPTLSRIVYPELWPGIDMVFHGDDGQLKYEFRVRPGADPADIRLAYAGANRLAVDNGGALLIGTSLGELRDSAPVSYQDIDGVRVPVSSRYVVGQSTEYGFAVGAFRPDQELVIDPALQYSTFLGGGSMDRGPPNFRRRPGAARRRRVGPCPPGRHHPGGTAVGCRPGSRRRPGCRSARRRGSTGTCCAT
jgi:hypothetical protein